MSWDLEIADRGGGGKRVQLSLLLGVEGVYG